MRAMTARIDKTREARANLETTLAIEHSATTGRPVTLPLAG